MNFGDYDEMCARAREIHVEALEAQKKKALSPTYTAKQDTADRIKLARLEPNESLMEVYFLQESGVGAIKIGASINVAARVSAIRRGMPHDLTLLATTPGGYRVEALTKRLFSYACIRGEWFRPVPELLAYIDEIKSQKEDP